MMFRTVFMATLFLSGAAYAGPQACAARGDIIDRLADKYGEVPVGMGLTSTGKVIEILKSDNGSWSIVMTGTDGKTCAMAVGEGWSDVPATQRQPVGLGS